MGGRLKLYQKNPMLVSRIFMRLRPGSQVTAALALWQQLDNFPAV